MNIKLETPLTDEKVRQLKIGDTIELSGYIYTARDSAHKKLVDLLKQGKELPFDIKGSVIYYVGPSPAKPGKVIGSAGPTTSYRMDPFVEDLMKVGLKGMIGKGSRGDKVVQCLKDYKGVYFGATGGAASLIAKRIVESEVIAFDELGPEAVRKLRVVDLPLVVINDCEGNDLYIEGRKKWAK